MNFILPIHRGTYHILDIQLTHLESNVAHGGASNPNCSWRRLRYQSNQEWSPYGGDFNFILFLFSYISYVVLKVCPVFDHWWHSRDVLIALSFTDQLRDTICVDSYSLHLLHVSISRVVFCRSTPGYQIMREVSVMNGRSSVPTWVCSWSPWRRTWISTFAQLNVSIHVYSWIRRMSVTRCTCTRSSV